MVTKLKFNLVTSLVSDHDQDGPSINGSLLKTRGFHLYAMPLNPSLDVIFKSKKKNARCTRLRFLFQ